MAPEYGSRDYWDGRYMSERRFEWYVVNGETLASLAQSILSKIDDEDGIRPPHLLLKGGSQIRLQRHECEREHVLLEAGCGSSPLTGDLIRLGAIPLAWRCVAFDWSGPCVAARRSEPTVSGLTYECWDAKRLPVSDASVSAVVDKGCLDATDCEAADGDAAPRRVAREYCRALTVGGALLLVTCRDPRRRVDAFRGDPWDVELVARLPDRRDATAAPVFLLLRKYADVGDLRHERRAKAPLDAAHWRDSAPARDREPADDAAAAAAPDDESAARHFASFLQQDDDGDAWRVGLLDSDDDAGGADYETAMGYGDAAAEGPPGRRPSPAPSSDSEAAGDDPKPPPPPKRGGGAFVVAALASVAIASVVAARRR